MPTEDPAIRVIRNLRTLERLGKTVGVRLAGVYAALIDEIAADLARIDPTAPSAARFRKMRTEKVIAEVRRRMGTAARGALVQLRADLASVGVQQGEWATATLVTSLGEIGDRVARTRVTRAMLRAIMDSEPFGTPGQGQVALLAEWVEGLGASTQRALTQQIRAGMLAEESVPDIVRRIRGRRVAGGSGFSGGVLQATTRNAEAIARTAVNFVATQAHETVWAENADILAGLEFTAVLDDRTTEICAALDGTIYGLKDGSRPLLPIHVNERSLYVPIPDWQKLGVEPPPNQPRAARDLSGVSEEDLNRRVSARRRTGDLGQSVQVRPGMRYEHWLRDQRNAVQDRVLGRGKADLFRARQITLKDIIREDNTVRPLSELLR